MELFYRKYGEGPSLIIVHGLYGSSDNWISIGKILSEHFEVYLIDQRNHGRSPHSENHNYEALKEDLKQFIEQHQIGKTILIGHSMGGKTVMFFAHDYPERISSLIVLDISPRSYKDTFESSSQSMTHLNIINSMLKVDFHSVKSRQDVDHQLAESIHSAKIRQFLLKNLTRSKTNQFHWKLNLPVLQKELPNILEGFDENSFKNGNGITGFPVLFIRGETSDYIRDQDIPFIKKIFPYADVATVFDAGHWLHAEQPDKLIKTIKYFLLDD